MKKQAQDDPPSVDVERKHLEGLLKDRINFYLVFATGFIIGSFRIDDLIMRRCALIAGTLVSGLLAFAILRTHLLVVKALDELVLCYGKKHPYIKFRSSLWFRPNANYLLLPIPFLLTGLFLVLTVLSFYR